MKKILLVASLLLIAASVNAATFITNIVTAANPTNGFVLLTSRANVTSIQLYTTEAGNIVKFHDTATWTAPDLGHRIANAAYVTRSGYATNMVESFVGNNGYTNWYTNTGYFTYSVTNAAATNDLPSLTTVGLNANQVTTVPVDLLFTKGVSVVANTNVTVILNYNTGK